MPEKETIPLLNINKNKKPFQNKCNSKPPLPIPPPTQFTGYGRAVSSWCGKLKN